MKIYIFDSEDNIAFGAVTGLSLKRRASSHTACSTIVSMSVDVLGVTRVCSLWLGVSVKVKVLTVLTVSTGFTGK